MNKRLYRTEGPAASLCGVCGGIAEYFGVDPTLVRLGWVIVSLIMGAGLGGLVAYIICAIIMPKKSTLFPDL